MNYLKIINQKLVLNLIENKNKTYMNLMKHQLLIALFFCSCLTAIAQNKKVTLSGTIKDARNGETMIAASIRVLELNGVGGMSNEYGFYSVTIPEGKYHFIAAYTGFISDTIELEMNNTQQLNFNLKARTTVLKSISVKATRNDDNVKKAETGVEKIDMKEISKIPVLFGEKDILKTLQLLPGVKSAGEGNSGFFVRGGAADQNLILLDEAPVYNASHLLGFFSTFNSDALKDVTMYKGTQPVQYGGRLASALDIRMKDGNKQKFEANGSIGLISSKLSLEGPIAKDKGSFFISGRRTYVDQFLKLSSDTTLNKSKLYFYDLNAKANYKFGKKDVLYLSGYFGRDELGVGKSFGIDWGNVTGTLRWNHILNSKLFSNTSLIYSNYDYKISVSSGGSDIKITSQIKDFNVKEEMIYYPNSNHQFRFGINSIHHEILPGNVSGNSDINKFDLQTRYSFENALYAGDDWKISKKMNMNIGVRASAFTVLGNGKFYNLNNNYNIIDTVFYEKGKVVKNYINVEPRFTMSYLLNETSSIKASYNRNTQNLHLLSNSTSSTPTDKWIGNSNIIKPEIADQVSLGYFRNFKNNSWELSVESYYKYMQNQLDYKNGANTQSNDAIETELRSGIGRAYGIEFYLKKKFGRFNGWVSYTLSKTERKIDGINNNEWYLAKQDKTHDVSFVLMYDVSKRVNVAATWVYSTGNAVTFPSGKYWVDNQSVWLYTDRNGSRMPSYHRLDVGLTLKMKEHKHWTSEWVFGMYNAYGRQNAWTITFQQNADNPSKTEALKTALFSYIPSVSWNFKIK
jgi:hypothetical protein